MLPEKKQVPDPFSRPVFFFFKLDLDFFFFLWGGKKNLMLWFFCMHLD